MSFSSNVKKEILNKNMCDRHCRIAELAAAIYCNGKLTHDGLLLNPAYDYIKEIIEKDFDYKLSNNLIADYEVCRKILLSTGFMDKQTGEVNFGLQSMTIKNTCCKRAFLKSAFVYCGSVTNPEKSYHAEFSFNAKEKAVAVNKIIGFFELDSKIVARKANYIVYLKEKEQIVDLLNIIGAYAPLLELESLLVTKDIRNNLNRQVNFEAANIKKISAAAVKQINDIENIIRKKGFGYLPLSLREIAEARLENSEISLAELGEMLSPPVGKSGVYHRLRKISEIADSLGK